MSEVVNGVASEYDFPAVDHDGSSIKELVIGSPAYNIGFADGYEKGCDHVTHTNNEYFWNGYEQGSAEREKEIEKAFKSILGNEYSWYEIIEKAEQMKGERNRG